MKKQEVLNRIEHLIKSLDMWKCPHMGCVDFHIPAYKSNQILRDIHKELKIIQEAGINE